MKRKAALVFSVCLAVAAVALAEDHDSCPLHAEHMKQAAHQSMVERGDAVMGFAAAKTTHHFRLLNDGGSIEVSANQATDASSIASIRKHLSLVAAQFGAGDFSMPEKTHAVAPPGVEGMSRLSSEIHYSYEETARGARVRIATTNSEALHAVHDFLRFQIQEHETGDPLQPADR